MAQEAFHSIEVKRLCAMVIKVYLSKPYDRVNWLYLRLLLIYWGFDLHFVNWVMNFISLVSFVLLKNLQAC